MTRSWLKLMKLCSRDSTHSRHITEANHRIYSLDEIPTNYTAHESTQSYTSAMTTWGVYICTTSGGVRIFMYWSSYFWWMSNTLTQILSQLIAHVTYTSGKELAISPAMKMIKLNDAKIRIWKSCLRGYALKRIRLSWSRHGIETGPRWVLDMSISGL